MTARARYATPEHSGYSADEFYSDLDVSPDERIGPAPAGRGRKLMLRAMLLSAVLYGGWVVYNDPSLATRSWSAATAAVMPLIERATSVMATPEPATLASQTPPANAEPAPKMAEVATALPTPASPAPTELAKNVEIPVTTAALPPSAKPVEEAPVAAARAPATDPYQKRAEAAGLHPDLSRVLLAQLSDADYRNAAVAVRTAVVETPDDGALVWPRQRKAGEALFKITFVPGAAPSCRRYVVIVAKEGWLTTALPMEKCGVQRAAAKAGAVPRPGPAPAPKI